MFKGYGLPTIGMRYVACVERCAVPNCCAEAWAYLFIIQCQKVLTAAPALERGMLPTHAVQHQRGYKRGCRQGWEAPPGLGESILINPAARVVVSMLVVLSMLLLCCLDQA